MGINIADLGPAARAQALKKLQELEREKKSRPKLPKQEGSQLEAEYYTAFILPKIAAGLVAEVETHKRFELLPKEEYCGLSLPAAHYTPDFIITYKTGAVEVVEVKHEAIRRNQRDYIYRRRLFIDRYARPNGWVFTEYIKQERKSK